MHRRKVQLAFCLNFSYGHLVYSVTEHRYGSSNRKSSRYKELQAVTTSSSLCSPHITGKCSVPFHWTEQLRHFSHDKMYQGPHYLLSERSSHLLCCAACGGGGGGLVSVGWTRLEGERKVRWLHTLSAGTSRSMVTAEMPQRSEVLSCQMP